MSSAQSAAVYNKWLCRKGRPANRIDSAVQHNTTQQGAFNSDIAGDSETKFARQTMSTRFQKYAVWYSRSSLHAANDKNPGDDARVNL